MFCACTGTGTRGNRYGTVTAVEVPLTYSVQDGEVLPMGGGGDVLATGGQGGRGVGRGEGEEEEEEMTIFDKHDVILHGESKTEKFVSSRFMKKFIHVARALKPVLTREACDIISSEYAKLRAQETAGRDNAKVRRTWA